MTLCSALAPLPTAAEEAFYGDDLIWMEGAVAEFILRLDCLRRLRLAHGARDPIEHCKARIKSASSMRDKLERQGRPATRQAAREQVFDGVGVRVVCPFVDDLAVVADMIRSIPGVTVLREKDYVRAPKPNGYRSRHMILRYPMEMAGETRAISLEIQLRTIAMDCWACLEHEMKYKHEVDDATLVASELADCARTLASADLSMQTIRDWISGGGEEVRDE